DFIRHLLYLDEQRQVEELVWQGELRRARQQALQDDVNRTNAAANACHQATIDAMVRQTAISAARKNSMLPPLPGAAALAPPHHAFPHRTPAQPLPFPNMPALPGMGILAGRGMMPSMPVQGDCRTLPGIAQQFGLTASQVEPAFPSGG